jgi:2-keto-4-pentenoate hydratase
VSSIDDGLCDELASALHEARVTGRPIPPPTDAHPALSIADAYAIQRRGRTLREASGARLVGRKIGLTSQAMQEMLGVDQPDFGYLTDDMLDPSGAVVSLAGLIAPRVEAEIAFRFGAPLSGSGLDAQDVLAATSEVAPAFELIDSRVADWRIRIADTIADNASSARVVLGAFRPIEDLDLRDVEMEMAVTPGPAGEARSVVTGRGDAVLGHPAAAVAWLVAALDAYGGEGIAAGDIVIPGAMARALPVAPGARAHAAFSGLGDVSVEFGAERAVPGDG